MMPATPNDSRDAEHISDDIPERESAVGGSTGKLLLTEREAAAVLSISPRKLWELRMCRKIPCIRFGRAVRYDPEDLTAWIKSNKTRTTMTGA
ncbi:MAG: helix-turn-helix domain-containing protein [Planctomycetota bacterium]